jgi:ABC-type multidrug transport system permease subunit
MYHPGIDALSSLASTWPLKLVSVTLFSTDLYFLAGLKREPGAYFTFILFIYTTVLIMGSMFRLIAAVNKHEATATSIAGVLILPMVIYTGCKPLSLLIGRDILLNKSLLKMLSHLPLCIHGSNGSRISIHCRIPSNH